jgi:hypothetical protein
MVIYALTDPRIGLVRYVGKAKDLLKRFAGHLDEARREQTHKARWIRALKREGLIPGTLILEEVEDGREDQAERLWIKKFPPGQLTNATEGGEGGRLSPQAQAKCTEGIRRAAKEGRTGFKGKHSEAAKQKMRAAALRRMEQGKSPFQDKTHQSKASIARWSDPERRQAGREAARKQWAEKRQEMIASKNGARHLT